MNSKSLLFFVVVCVSVLTNYGMETADAQSSSRSAAMAQPGYAVPASGSSNRAVPATRPQYAAPSIGLDGYCPVCIVEMKKWVRGNNAFMATYDGKTYFFPGQEQLDTFRADPAKYTPALGGDCTVCLGEMQKRVPGSIQHTALLKNKLYLFPGAKQKQMFLANPRKYHTMGDAMNGKCVVCKVEMNKDVQGNEAFTALHDGVRYLFPGAAQRKMFLANPSKYVNATR